MLQQCVHHFLRFAAFRSVLSGNAQSSLDLDRLCDLTNPEHRSKVLEEVENLLKDKYHIAHGHQPLSTYDPRDSNMDACCMNYNNGSTTIPCPDNKCPPETPSSSPGTMFYQPKQDHALVPFGCLPPKTYLYEKAKTYVPDDLD